RVDRRQLPRVGRGAHRRGDAVCGEDERGAFGYLVDRVDEDGAALLELPHDVRVVNDLLAHVHGPAVEPERTLDRVDGPLDPCAVAPGRGEEDPLDQTAPRIAP